VPSFGIEVDRALRRGDGRLVAQGQDQLLAQVEAPRFVGSPFLALSANGVKVWARSANQVRRCERFAREHRWKIVQTFSDAAVSGASTDRDGLNDLLAGARGGAFRAGPRDDISRLSRDLGDLFRLVFEDFVLAGVVVVDCQTGTRSDQAGARMMFGAVGLAADAFLQMVRHETYRGLEGRALKDFHTGGRCYGYRTIPEPNPEDPRRIRALLVVDLAEAAVVRRVFEAYAAGMGLREIADMLNREKIPAPYDGCGYKKRAGRGWGHGTIRAMLRNERYIGRVTWNKRRWHRAGSRKRRLPRTRPAAEWITRERPDLVIIEREIWDAVQARLSEKSLGRPKGHNRDGYQTSAVSGILRCGVCGSRMSIVGQVTKGGQVYRSLGCSAHFSKGPDVCKNGLRISEMKAIAALLETVRQSLAHPRFRERFAETFQRLWAAAERERERRPRPTAPRPNCVPWRRSRNVSSPSSRTGLETSRPSSTASAPSTRRSERCTSGASLARSRPPPRRPRPRMRSWPSSTTCREYLRPPRSRAAPRSRLASCPPC
jgi:site-specific DNA recombinase